MARLMSVAFTEAAVLERRKTVTRRKGWWEDKRGRRILNPGDRLTLCRKVMGRRPGEPLERICDVEVVSVTREPLLALGMDETYAQHEMEREGFPGMDPAEFIEAFFVPQGLSPAMDDVTRIEWRYLSFYVKGDAS